MLSIGKIGIGNASPAYYVDQVADGREDYYTGVGEAKGQQQAPLTPRPGRCASSLHRERICDLPVAGAGFEPATFGL